jgi:acetyl esterase/lipase
MATDVYLPPGSAGDPTGDGRRPAVIAIHGGSWRGGSRMAFRSGSSNTIIRLADRGLVVFAIDYRLALLSSPAWPAVLEDLRESVRWVRRNAGRFGIDPDRITLLGQSSGAHLAALVAALPGKPAADGVSARVQAVVSFYGPTDLALLATERHLAHEPVLSFLGARDPRQSESARNASPINQITSDAPPTLLLHGSDDVWVPLEHSERMARALVQAGVRNRLIVVPGARHGFEAAVEYPERLDLLPEILAFLESAGIRRRD